MPYLFICPKCGASYGCNDPDEFKKCNDCNTATFYSGYTEDEWYAMPFAKRNTLKKELMINNSDIPEETKRQIEAKKKEEEEKARIRREAEADIENRRRSFLASTTNSFEGCRITKYLGIESGEVVLGTGLFSEFSASISDFTGSENSAFAEKLERAKHLALERLKDNCIYSGANAVVGVDLDIMTIGSNMIVACANGTAVIIENIE